MVAGSSRSPLSKACEATRPTGSVRVRRATTDDAGPVARLIEPGFLQHIAPTLSIVGRVAFRMYVTEKALRERLAAGAIAWCAEASGEDAVIGYAELRGADGHAGGSDHLSLLFTAVAYHRQGIARRLLDTIIGHRREVAPSAGPLTVNASAFALPIYERLGFVRHAAATEEDGIVATPMQLEHHPRADDAPEPDTHARSAD